MNYLYWILAWEFFAFFGWMVHFSRLEDNETTYGRPDWIQNKGQASLYAFVYAQIWPLSLILSTGRNLWSLLLHMTKGIRDTMNEPIRKYPKTYREHFRPSNRFYYTSPHPDLPGWYWGKWKGERTDIEHDGTNVSDTSWFTLGMTEEIAKKVFLADWLNIKQPTQEQLDLVTLRPILTLEDDPKGGRVD